QASARPIPVTSGVSPWFGRGRRPTNLGREPDLPIGMWVGLTAEVGCGCAARSNHGLTPEVTNSGSPPSIEFGVKQGRLFDAILELRVLPDNQPNECAETDHEGFEQTADEKESSK